MKLWDVQKVRETGPGRGLLLLALAASMSFVGVFVAVGIVIDGHFDANWRLL